MIKKVLFITVIILAIFSHSGNALTIFGDGTLGHFTGSFSYLPTNSTQGTLTVVLKNTSTTNGLYLTGFVFNNPGNTITGVSLSGTNTNFELLGGPSFNNIESGSPYGDFDIGAALGGKFLGGGSPNGGIPNGTTETFTFTLTGTNLNTLNDNSFYTTLSSNPEQGSMGQWFLARFKGPDSDKVPGREGVVPEPATVSLLGLGLAGILKFRKRKEVT